uniref:CCHC-type domain-containing protein n=1 Tax=Ananas comosus var. bracteatus TaxID=296719 RepID=A0A6V7QJ26_ANACO|nr:unnamed protein product [Ananas comosus var. bracteatus]
MRGRGGALGTRGSRGEERNLLHSSLLDKSGKRKALQKRVVWADEVGGKLIQVLRGLDDTEESKAASSKIGQREHKIPINGYQDWRMPRLAPEEHHEAEATLAASSKGELREQKNPINGYQQKIDPIRRCYCGGSILTLRNFALRHFRSSRLPSTRASAPSGAPFSSRLEKRCFRCLARDHVVAVCRDPLRCRRCRRTGHRAKFCNSKLATPAAAMNRAHQHRGRAPLSKVYVPFTEEYLRRVELRRNALLADVIPPANLGPDPIITIKSALARRFGGYNDDFAVARCRERDFAIFLPEWVPAGVLTRREVLTFDGFWLRCYPWGQYRDARPHHVQYKAWIRLINLPFEIWTVARVAALVSGFGRFIKADGPTKAMTDLRAFRCQIALDSIYSIPQTLSVIIGEELFPVMVHLERWERSDAGGANAPPGRHVWTRMSLGRRRMTGTQLVKLKEVSASATESLVAGGVEAAGSPRSHPAPTAGGEAQSGAVRGRGPPTGRCGVPLDARDALGSRKAVRVALGSRMAETGSPPASCIRKPLDQGKRSFSTSLVTSSYESSIHPQAGRSPRRGSRIYCEARVPEERTNQCRSLPSSFLQKLTFSGPPTPPTEAQLVWTSVRSALIVGLTFGHSTELAVGLTFRPTTDLRDGIFSSSPHQPLLRILWEVPYCGPAFFFSFLEARQLLHAAGGRELVAWPTDTGDERPAWPHSSSGLPFLEAPPSADDSPSEDGEALPDPCAERQPTSLSLPDSADIDDGGSASRHAQLRASDLGCLSSLVGFSSLDDSPPMLDSTPVDSEATITLSSGSQATAFHLPDLTGIGDGGSESTRPKVRTARAAVNRVSSTPITKTRSQAEGQDLRTT